VHVNVPGVAAEQIMQTNSRQRHRKQLSAQVKRPNAMLGTISQQGTAICRSTTQASFKANMQQVSSLSCKERPGATAPAQNNPSAHLQPHSLVQQHYTYSICRNKCKACSPCDMIRAARKQNCTVSTTAPAHLPPHSPVHGCLGALLPVVMNHDQ
jgi:hypothetical protein